MNRVVLDARTRESRVEPISPDDLARRRAAQEKERDRETARDQVRQQARAVLAQRAEDGDKMAQALRVLLGES